MASHRAAALVALLAAVCVLSAPCTTLAQNAGGVRPSLDGLGGTFSNFTAADFKFKYTFPRTYVNKIEANNAPALAASNLTSRVFFLKPCSLFVPHFHPQAAEYFQGIHGRINLNALINDKLVRNTITRTDAVVVPPNTLHYFWNNGCSDAALFTTLDNANPGFQGYYNLSSAILGLTANAQSVVSLIDDNVSNSTLDVGSAFFNLTNDCSRKCFRRVKYCQAEED